MTDTGESSTIPTEPERPRGESPAEAERRADELAAAVAARDSFIAQVGHELRNAVAPMVLIAEQFKMLTAEPGAAAFASRVAQLDRHLTRFVTMIDRVADVTDVRRGKLKLDPVPLDAVELAREVCREAEREAAAGSAELVVDAPGPVTGHWDRLRMKQIIANLVSNAIRYAGGRIEVCVRGRGDAVELTVRDHGPGIDPQLLPRIFDRFDHERTGRRGGLGIGLWLVKALCTAMQGSLTADNRVGGGASFCAVLPRG